MSQVRLVQLKLRNFKGLREFVFGPDGYNASVWGENGTGKTTIVDAFTWLLFGKDSLNRSDFEVKQLNPIGEPEHGLEHEVEAILSVDSSGTTLKKILTEEWTKKRGTSMSEFTGHSVAHFVDGVPKSEREYNEAISGIADKNLFRLLTNPRHFSEVMKWQDRRRVLLDVCGDVSDLDIIESNPELSEIPSLLGKHSLDDFLKILSSRKSEINKALSSIPARINENQQSISDPGISPEELSAKKADLQKDKAEHETILLTLKSGGIIPEMAAGLRELEARAIELSNQVKYDLEAKLQHRRDDLNKAKSDLSAIKSGVDSHNAVIIENKTKIEAYSAKLNELRTEWMDVDREKFEYSLESICPACGQALPTHKVAEAREKALKDFNLHKAKRLESINKDGKMHRSFMDRLESVNQKCVAAIHERETEAARISTLVLEIESKIELIQNSAPDISGQLLELNTKKSALISEMESIKANREPAIFETREKIADLEKQLEDLNQIQASIEHAQKALARIEKLKKEERSLAGEYETIESQIFLCENFIKSKVTLLTDRINSRFRIARFKLFSKNINGGIEPCCDVMVNGVPHVGLNNSMRIISGLDIIETLCEHYEINMPVFVDNAESTTQFPETKSQLIRLYVSAPDKTLRVTRKENENVQRAA